MPPFEIFRSCLLVTHYLNNITHSMSYAQQHHNISRRCCEIFSENLVSKNLIITNRRQLVGRQLA